MVPYCPLVKFTGYLTTIFKRITMLNKAMLIGHLGSDPEIRYSTNGTPVVSVSLATNKKTRNKATGELKDHTEWHDLIFFGKLAETVEEHLSKGSRIYAEGEMQTKKWHDKKNNVDRYSTEIVLSNMSMLSMFIATRQPEQTTTDPRPDEAKVAPDVQRDEYQNETVFVETIPTT